MAKKRARLKDVKAEQAAKKRKAKRVKRALFLLAEVLLLAIMLYVAYYFVTHGNV